MLRKINSSISKKTFLAILGLLAFCCIVIYGMVMYFLPKNYQSKLKSQFIADFHMLVNTLEAEGMNGNTQNITDFAVRNNTSVRIVDAAGKEVSAVKAALSDTQSTSVQSCTATATFVQDGATYTVFATASFVAAAQSYDILLGLIPLIIVTVLIISVGGAYYCSRYFSKPLVDICAVARKMTHFDMTWKCNTSRNDEIGVLAASLNELSERLTHALNKLQTANNQLQQDIEQERVREKQRIDFFTAVSHELKTPITILKGEVEGMIYQVGEYRDRDTCLRHAMKTISDMEHLVNEILEAAKMGETTFYITMTALNLSDMIKKICRRMQGIAEDKEIKMHLDIQPDIHYHGDGRLIRKALTNIISNAIFHSFSRANVMISLKGNVLQIENTGVHIPPEDLEQLFIPFYRVDKSRSRHSGGSGLGLYLSKMIFDHHNIDCQMENSRQGVKVTITFQ